MGYLNNLKFVCDEYIFHLLFNFCNYILPCAIVSRINVPISDWGNQNCHGDQKSVGFDPNAEFVNTNPLR